MGQYLKLSTGLVCFVMALLCIAVAGCGPLAPFPIMDPAAAPAAQGDTPAAMPAALPAAVSPYNVSFESTLKMLPQGKDQIDIICKRGGNDVVSTNMCKEPR